MTNETLHFIIKNVNANMTVKSKKIAFSSVREKVNDLSFNKCLAKAIARGCELNDKDNWSEIDCSFDVGREATNLRQKKRIPGKNSDEWETLMADMRLETAQRPLSDEQIRYCCKIKKKKIAYIGLTKEDGGKIWIDSYTKGSKSYGFKNSQKIKKRCEKFQKLKPEVYFMTWTCDVKKYDNNRMSAWNEWIDEMHEKMAQMAKDLNCLYVSVVESTYNQFPHIHALIFFDKGTQKGYEKIPANVDLRFGTMFRTLRKYRPCRIWNLKKPKGEAVTTYLTKYLSKSNADSLAKIAKKKGDLSKEERKNVCSWIYTSMFKRRQFFTSQMPKGKELDGMKDYGRYWSEKTERRAVKEGWFRKLGVEQFTNIALQGTLNDKAVAALREASENSTREARCYLIYLCINFSCNRERDVRFIRYNDFQKAYEEDMKKNHGEKPPIADKIFELTEKRTCPGCFWTHLKRIVLGDLDDSLNIKYLKTEMLETEGEIVEVEVPIKYITKEDFKNDAVFLTKIGEIWNIWNKCCDGGGTNFEDFLYSYSMRQEWVRKAEMKNEYEETIPNFIKKATEDEVIAVFSSDAFDFLNKNLDMEKEGLKDVRGTMTERKAKGFKKKSLWQQRCETMGTKGL